MKSASSPSRRLSPIVPDGQELDLSPCPAAQEPQEPRQRQLSGKLAGLSLPRQVFVLAIWPFLEQLLNFLVGFVDTAIAGHLSVQATNAIAVAAYIGWLINLVQAAVGIGAMAIIARAIGAGHRRQANAALGQAMVLALVAGTLIGSLVYCLAPQIGGYVRLQDESLAFCVTYLRIVSLAAPASALLFVGSAALRGAGDTKTPFFVLVAVNIVNTGLSLLLTVGPTPLGGMGVAGIAWGTFVAWLVGAGLILWTLIRGWGGIRLYAARLKPYPPMAWRLFRLGLPNLLETFLAIWIANYTILRVVGELGDPAAWAAHAITIRLEAMSYLPGFALGTAAATLVGQYLGLGDPQRARQAALVCWKACMGIMAVLGLLFVFIPQTLVGLVTNQPELLAISPALLRMTGFVQIFFASAIVFRNAILGAGDTKTALVLMAISTYGVRLPLAYFLGVHLALGLKGIWYGLCCELAFRGLIFSARFFHGGWMKVKV